LGKQVRFLTAPQNRDHASLMWQLLRKLRQLSHCPNLRLAPVRRVPQQWEAVAPAALWRQAEVAVLPSEEVVAVVVVA
jgi:hypothetical protein